MKRPWRAATGSPSMLARTSTSGPACSTRGRADEDAAQRLVVAGEVEIGLEARDLAAVAVALHDDVDGRASADGGLAGEHDHARRRCRARAAANARSGSSSPYDVEQQADRRRLAARDSTSAVEPSSSAGVRTSTASAPSRRSIADVLAEGALERQHADRADGDLTSRGLRAALPRESACGGEAELIGSPRPRGDAREHLGVAEVGRRLDDRLRARRDGSSDLKMPEPTKTPSAPSCMHSAASAGVAMPPAVKMHDGQAAVLGDPLHELVGRAQVLGLGVQLVLAQRAAGGGSRPGSRACGARPRRRCRCRPRPSCGSSPRPRRCAAAPRRDRCSRRRTAP